MHATLAQFEVAYKIRVRIADHLAERVRGRCAFALTRGQRGCRAEPAAPRPVCFGFVQCIQGDAQAEAKLASMFQTQVGAQLLSC